MNPKGANVPMSPHTATRTAADADCLALIGFFVSFVFWGGVVARDGWKPEPNTPSLTLAAREVVEVRADAEARARVGAGAAMK